MFCVLFSSRDGIGDTVRRMWLHRNEDNPYIYCLIGKINE